MAHPQTHATIWLVNDLEWDPDWQNCHARLNDLLQSKYPEIWNNARYGDLLEDTHISGYRSDGVQAFGRTPKGDLTTIWLDHSWDDYGSVPCEFEAIREFPLDYWDYEQMEVRDPYATTTEPPQARSYWHGDSPIVAVPLFAPSEIQVISETMSNGEPCLVFSYDGKTWTIDCTTAQTFFNRSSVLHIDAHGPCEGWFEGNPQTGDFYPPDFLETQFIRSLSQ